MDYWRGQSTEMNYWHWTTEMDHWSAGIDLECWNRPGVLEWTTGLMDHWTA